MLITIGICAFLYSCDTTEESASRSYSLCEISVPQNLPTSGPDPLLDYQWYLDKSYIKEAWRIYENLNTKASIEVSVVDDALQIDHEDLAANIVPNNGLNILVNTGHLNKTYPYPISNSNIDCSRHGTAVSGIIAAIKDNGRGIKGVASVIPNIKIWGANLIAVNTFSSFSLNEVYSHRVQETAVSSNSWGQVSETRLRATLSTFGSSIRTGINEGFNGKGISYIFSAGNDRLVEGINNDGNALESSDRASYSEQLNNRAVIPVCAVGYDDRFAAYSTPGPNLWVCSYSSTGKASFAEIDINNFINNYKAGFLQTLGIPTTDLSGDHGYNLGTDTVVQKSNIDSTLQISLLGDRFNFASPRLSVCNLVLNNQCSNTFGGELPWPAGAQNSYTRYFTGTSAATPIVAGIVALIRSAYPDLTWRDIKLILAGSAWQPDGTISSSQTVSNNQGTGNVAIQGVPTYHNNSLRYNYSHDYGFGILNASLAMQIAEKWNLLPAEVSEIYPNSGFTRSAITVANSEIDFIEYVQVELSANPSIDFSQLTIELISPSNKRSIFATPHQCFTTNDSEDKILDEECFDLENGFIFGSSVYLGENPAGSWSLSIRSSGSSNPVPQEWKLYLYGH